MLQNRPIADHCHLEKSSGVYHARRKPICITQDGCVDQGGMNRATYAKMMENVTVDTAISEAESEYERNGQLHDAREALDSLRKKYFG